MGCHVHKAERPVVAGPTLLEGKVAVEGKRREHFDAPTPVRKSVLFTPRQPVSPSSATTRSRLTYEATGNTSSSDLMGSVSQLELHVEDDEPEPPSNQLPERLWLVSQGVPSLEGEYSLVQGVMAHGEALWQRTTGEGWLFCCTMGRWTFAERKGDIERNFGLLRTADPHYARFPHECTRWLRLSSLGEWCADSDTLVTQELERANRRIRSRQERTARLAAAAQERLRAAPASLWLLAPPRPAWQGEYRIESDRHENGYPVWKQVGGDGWLFSASSEVWVICGGAPRVQRRNQRQIRSAAPHGGKWPHEVQNWKYTADTGGWSTDFVRAIRIATDASLAEGVLANYGFEAG